MTVVEAYCRSWPPGIAALCMNVAGSAPIASMVQRQAQAIAMQVAGTGRVEDSGALVTPAAMEAVSST